MRSASVPDRRCPPARGLRCAQGICATFRRWSRIDLRARSAGAASRMKTAQTSTPPLPPAIVDELTVSVVIPCLNEEENIERCVRLAREVMDEAGIAGEVVVADNASEDRSAELATAAGAHVVHEPRRGYGSAYLAGFAAARGRYIVMADADLTYD